jgi:hypothetical protein
MRNTKRLTILGSALLLSAALALPAPSGAAPSPDPKPPAHAQKHKKDKKAQEVRRDRNARPAPRRDRDRYDDRYRYDDRHRPRYEGYRGGGGGRANPNIYHIDGYLVEDRGRCQVLRDHEGRVFSLVGGTRGLYEGDHVRLYGRNVYDDRCPGQGFEVHDVRTVWADPRHRQTYYDHLHDGPFHGYRQH